MTKVYSQKDLMQLAIEEHLKCLEFPRVGAVVAKGGTLLATGRRGERSKVHAERVALEKVLPPDRFGSTVYTTLEPCVCIYENQAIESCADLIITSGVKEVFIGVLDPNAAIYSQGFKKLLENNISVKFFNRNLRDAVEQETFEFGEFDKLKSSGKRRVPVVASGIELDVQFGNDDIKQVISFNWATLQPTGPCVDLSSSNGAVRKAAGARTFSDVTDPDVFRFPSHVLRMEKGMIAIVRPEGATFYVLIKLLEIFEKDIMFQWESRNYP